MAVLVCAHPAGPLGPWHCGIPSGSGGSIDFTFFIGGEIHLPWDWRDLDLGHFAGLDVGLADGVHVHLRPPGIPIAIGGQPIGVSDPIRVLVDRRLELCELFRFWVEPYGSRARGSPNLSFTIHVNGSGCRGGAGHTFGHRKYLDLFAGGIDSGQPSLAPFHTSTHIEPEDSLRIPA